MRLIPLAILRVAGRSLWRLFGKGGSAGSGLLLRGLFTLALLASPAAADAQDAASSGAPAVEKWALLLGINDYAEIRDLKYCRRDIQMLHRRLIAAGFPEENIVLMHDDQADVDLQPFRPRIEKKLDELVKRVGRGDLVLFAFSGHGVHVGETSYLCPIEARLDRPEETGISLAEVYGKLSACPAARKILLVDACRNNPEPGGDRSIDTAPDMAAGFVRGLESPPEGMVVLSSCAPGQVSVEDDKMGHGVFMHFVLRGLAGEADRDGNENGTVSLFELFRYTSLKTRSHVARTRDLLQTPMLRGEITADFGVARVPRPAAEAQVVWRQIRDNSEQMAAESPVLRRILEVYRHQASRLYPGTPMSTRDSQAAMRRMCYSPEAVVVANPSLITARDPAALLALQRAYAFGMRGDFNGMIAAASEAIRLEPDNPFGYLLRGSGHAARDMGRRMIAQTYSHMFESFEDAFAGGNRQYSVEVVFRTIESMLERGVSGGMPSAAEFYRFNAGLLDDLRAAKNDSTKFKQILETALARLHDTEDLKHAVADHASVGLETMGIRVSTPRNGLKTSYGVLLKQEGDRVLVRWVGTSKQDESWVPHDRVVPISVFSQIQTLTMYL